jgi:replicative DNA helicase
VAQLFGHHKIYDVRLTKYKDANAYLEAGEGEELKRIWWNAKEYLPEELTSSLSDFKKILEEEPKWGVPYPFNSLNEKTYGIRTGETVLITAREGVGKTEVMHTILHKLLKETTANVGCLFLEESNKRTLEALVGIEIGRPIHLPDDGTLLEDKVAALERVVGSDNRCYLYKYNGIDDPDDVLGLIRLLVAGYQCKYVLFDLLHVVISGDRESDERRQLDYLITKLELMAVELDFALVIVSHVNDNGETRGSRYIAKAANIRIDLERDVEAGSLETHLTVSKNRYSGKTGYAGCIRFDPVSFTLKEHQVEYNDNELIESIAA